MINQNALLLVAPGIKNPDRIAELLDKICPKYGINTPNIFHEFIANVLHESKEFTHLEESLYYTHAQRIKDVWPYRFKDVYEAAAYLKSPERLAAKVYDKRADLGNIQPGDGWAFRGGGPIQITGRANYTMFTVYYNKKFGTNHPISVMAEMVRTDIEIGIHCACWVFAIAFKLIDEAENNYMKAIVRRINGGYTGLPERMEYLKRAQQYI